jgi:RHS repeat-associated protein
MASTPTNINPDEIRAATPVLQDLSQALGEAGSTLQTVHAKIKSAISGDTTGATKAIGDGSEEVTGVVGDGLTEGGRVMEGTSTRLHDYAGSMEATDGDGADAFNGLGTEAGYSGGEDGGGGSGGSRPGEGSRGGGDQGAGQDDPVGGKGVGGCGKAGEPVDVVTGQMVTSRIDVGLPGVLPLVLRRAYASRYEGAGLFGPGFCSTLDIRVSIGPDGIVFVDDDARKLAFPVPTMPGRQVLSSAGPRTVLTWDRSSDTIRVLNRDAKTSYEFTTVDAEIRRDGAVIRPLTAICDRHGNRITFGRDRGIPTLVTHSGGYRIAVETQYHPTGFRVEALSLLDAQGAETARLLDYRYDPAGRLIAVTDSSGAPFCYEWDEHDRIRAWINRTGYRFAYEYDERGRVARTEGDGGYLSGSFDYREDERVTVYTDSQGAHTEHHYDESGNVVRVVDPLGHAVATQYDRYGQVGAITDQTGARTVIERDQHGNRSRVHRPDGGVIVAEHDEHDDLRSLTEPGGAIWRYTYDGAGNLLSVLDPLGAATTYTYTQNGALASAVDSAGATTTTVSDRAGLLVGLTDAQGASWTLQRDALGRIVGESGPQGQISALTYDGRGSLLSRAAGGGAPERWEYDADGNCVRHTDPGGAATAFEIGPYGVIAARTGPDGARYAFAHDTELRLTTVTGPLGATWSYRFDPVGRLVGERDFDGRELAYELDPAGRVIRRVNAAAQAITLSRDALGRVVEQRDEAGDHSTRLRYDALDRLASVHSEEGELTYTRDAMGRVTSESFGGRSLTTSYDARGQAVASTTPSGRTSVRRFDAAGALLDIEANGRGFSFGHDRSGRETHRWLSPSVALTRSWTDSGQLSSLNLVAVEGPAGSGAARSLLERTYSYRADGALETVADPVFGTRRYSHDPAGRIVAVDAARWQERYAYDPAGNLTTAQDSRDPDSADAGQWEVSGTLLRSAGRTRYEYDAQGRLTSTQRRTLSGRTRKSIYAYDAYDRLIAATTPEGVVWNYRYDGLGRRIAKQRLDADGAVAEQYVFSWDWSRLAEQEHRRAATDRITVTTWDYEFGGYTPMAQDQCSYLTDAPQQVIDRQFHAIITDLVGTPTELVDPDTGAVAWRPHTTSWGYAVGADRDQHATDCPLRFPGQYHDSETGLDYNLFRYYDPGTGRYTTPDPLGLTPAPNPYAYVLDPLLWLDPLGLANVLGTAFSWRASQIQNARWDSRFPNGGRNYNNTSTAVVRALKPDGTQVDVVAGSGEGLSGAQRAMLNPTGTIPEVAAPNISNLDAEMTAKAHIESQGWTMVGGGASRNICPWCENQIRDAGGTLTGPLTAGMVNNPPAMRNAPFQGEREFGVGGAGGGAAGGAGTGCP